LKGEPIFSALLDGILECVAMAMVTLVAALVTLACGL
jgi:hypothetical protein